MNIFYLDEDPVVAATFLHDKHVVKMILETAQILSTVHDRWGSSATPRYRPSHHNHPSVLWAGNSRLQYAWLSRHGQALLQEYGYRWGKGHACTPVLQALLNAPEGLHDCLGWVPPPQCMPPEFQGPDTVRAYREYYLARKVDQSKWTRRDVPAFVQGELIMAKKEAKTETKTESTAAETKTEATGEAKTTGRGPKGVPDSAKITLLAKSNPKREGSKAHARFAKYVDGMTVAQALDAGVITPDLVYDTKHGFISIEGYSVPGGVLPPKEPKVAKPKADAGENKKAKAEKSEAQKAAEAAATAQAKEETMA